MFCTQCGMQLPDDARFCTNCGMNLEEPQINKGRQGSTGQSFIKNPQYEIPNGGTPAEPFVISEQKPKKSSGKILLILIPIVAAVAAAAVFLFFFISNKLKTADKPAIAFSSSAAEEGTEKESGTEENKDGKSGNWFSTAAVEEETTDSRAIAGTGESEEGKKETTAAETTAGPETEAPEAAFCGTWQGEGDSGTTIILRDDGTMIYEEIYSDNPILSEGCEGSWYYDEDLGRIFISVYTVADYQLSFNTDGEPHVLECDNGQRWSDENIIKAD